MTNLQSPKRYDLEDRTLSFAQRTRELVKRLRKSLSNFEDGKQLIRSSGSVGAIYIEANESISDKDFVHRIKVCRKEAKESRYGFRSLDISAENELDKARKVLIEESTELMNIFGSILQKKE